MRLLFLLLTCLPACTMPHTATDDVPTSDGGVDVPVPEGDAGPDPLDGGRLDGGRPDAGATPGSWVPPIGIPAPSWPSDLLQPRPSLPTDWTDERAPYYFVGDTGCDDSRARGTPAAPRCSLPTGPEAGSIIVLSGTITDGGTIAYRGTATEPIWILSAEAGARVTLPWDVSSSYLVIDGIHFDLSDRDGVGLGGDHLMLRGVSLANPFGSANGAGFAVYGTDIVFFRGEVSLLGDWLHDGADIDRHGMKVVEGTSDLWILESRFFHCQGDGVQVGDQTNAPGDINRVYVGRNEAYENLQFGFWTKNATDVIFSENVVHDQTRTTASGIGGGLGGQYDPSFVWFLNNVVSDSNTGIHVASASDGGGGPWLAIGNLLHGIGHGSCNPYDAGALSYRNDGGLTAIFNTIDDADLFGGFPPSGGVVRLSHNVLGSLRAGCDGLVADERPAASFVHDYNLFSSADHDPDGEAHRVVGDPRFAVPGSDWRLGVGSPAIDAGAAAEEAAFALFESRYGLDIRADLDGRARPLGGGWDLGAYETP